MDDADNSLRISVYDCKAKDMKFIVSRETTIQQFYEQVNKRLKDSADYFDNIEDF